MLGVGLALVIVVVALVVMIFLHELGHFLTAKRSGMKVTEFFLGFGPRIWSFQRGETEYGVKAIPAGAYVRIIGMNNLDESPPRTRPAPTASKPYREAMAVASAGSAMHFLMAFVAAVRALRRSSGSQAGQSCATSRLDSRASVTRRRARRSKPGCSSATASSPSTASRSNDFDQAVDLIQSRPGRDGQ